VSSASGECAQTRDLDAQLRRIGVKVIPLVALGNGIPDRLYVYGGLTLFVEYKADSNTLSPMQRQCIGQIASQGGAVCVCRFTSAGLHKEDIDGNMLISINSWRAYSPRELWEWLASSVGRIPPC